MTIKISCFYLSASEEVFVLKHLLLAPEPSAFGAYKNSRSSCLLFFIVLLSTVLLFSLAGCRQPKVFKIGIVNINPGLEPVVAGFKAGMSKKGFVEGKNIIYIYKRPQAGTDQIDAALKDLIAQKPDLLLTITTHVTQRARLAVKGGKMPVVFAPVFSPVESGLVNSLVHPGGNLTGIQVGGNIAKALEWHKTVVPKSRRILVPCKCEEENRVQEQSFSELEKAASKLGLELVVAEFQTLNDLKALMAAVPGDIDSIWLLNSPFAVSRMDVFTEAAIKRKLPLSTGTSQSGVGVLMSYGQNTFRTGEQASRLAHKILEGASPAYLPVETSDFYLTINLQTAHAIGIKVPDSVLQQADRIVR